MLNIFLELKLKMSRGRELNHHLLKVWRHPHMACYVMFWSLFFRSQALPKVRNTCPISLDSAVVVSARLCIIYAQWREIFPLEANMMMDLTGHANDCCGEKLLMLTRCHISDGGEELFSLTELWEPNRVKVHSFKKGTEQWVWVMENLSLTKFVHFSRAILSLMPKIYEFFCWHFQLFSTSCFGYRGQKNFIPDLDELRSLDAKFKLWPWDM